MAGFYSVFFFLTLYMQNVLGFSPTRAGLAYVPVAAMVAVSAGRGHRADHQDRDQAADRRRRGDRGGRRVLAVAHPGAGHYWTDLFPGLVVMAFGLGGVFVGVQTAAQAGVPPRSPGSPAR